MIKMSYSSGVDCGDTTCTRKCRNGGVCTSANKCTCQAGFYGELCQKRSFQFLLSNCEIRIEICAKACNLWIAKFNKELKVLNTKNLHFIVENGIKSKVCLKKKIQITIICILYLLLFFSENLNKMSFQTVLQNI